MQKAKLDCKSMMKNWYICMLKDACKETNIAASNIRLKILLFFFSFSYQDPQRDSPDRLCSSPGGTLGLAPPASAFWPALCQTSFLRVQHKFCSQNRKSCTEKKPGREFIFPLLRKTHPVSLLSAAESIPASRAHVLLRLLSTGWRIAWVNLPEGRQETWRDFQKGERKRWQTSNSVRHRTHPHVCCLWRRHSGGWRWDGDWTCRWCWSPGWEHRLWCI